MSLSLRDQLLQAGLISKKQAQDAGRHQHQHKVQKARQPSAPDERELAAQRAAEEKRARDQELARIEHEKQEQKARKAQVRQLVTQHRIARVSDSEQLYNFVDGKKIRRIPVSPEQRSQLIAGKLAIVRSEGRYELVSADIGERIRERDTHALVHLASEPAAPAEDDPYKDYVVPDDLTW